MFFAAMPSSAALAVIAALWAGICCEAGYTTSQNNTYSQSLSPLFARNDLSKRQGSTWVLPIGTCNADTPCVNGACCGSDNLCGYNLTQCGTGCASNCDAKAQCGQHAAEGSQKCPLNVCCSQYGFCGSTSDFCGKGCDSQYGGCGDPPRPSCGGGNSVSKRTIGYYESWANTRTCQSVSPEDLNLDGFTHLNFAFAFFDPSSYQIAPMDSNAASLYSRFTALKQNHNGLKTWISVGGWSFTDPGPTRTAFADMASNGGSRKTFIDGVIQFMRTYGFDGLDLDWEYPGADDRGGAAKDVANYVSLVQELKSAFGSTYGLSITLPTSYWYLQHFDLKSIQDSVDWFNVMAYDLHGTWDAGDTWVGPFIAPHTNITEIDLGLDLLWRAGVDPAKVVLGQGWYGRSFTLKDPSCNTPNGICQFTAGAAPGPCSAASGILDMEEITDIISKYNPPWVSYDDQDTLKQKATFANSRCLGGMMVWAMDQVAQTATNGLGPAQGGVSSADQADAQQMSADNKAGITCYTTDCGADCKSGTTLAAQMNGQPGQVSTQNRCDKNKYRSLCCDNGTKMGTCQWRGFKGAGISCITGCADGETELVENTNNHQKGQKDQTCNGGLQSYCCGGFTPAPDGPDYSKDAKDLAKSAAEAIAQQLALDVAAKAFCRIAVPALLAPLELLEDAIPIIGEIADLAEIAATPALIKLCADGIEKEGKASFKVFGKEHSLSIGDPTVKPTEVRPPKSTHTPPKSTSKDPNSCGIKARSLPTARALARRAGSKVIPSGKADPLDSRKVKPLAVVKRDDGIPTSTEDAARFLNHVPVNKAMLWSGIDFDTVQNLAKSLGLQTLEQSVKEGSIGALDSPDRRNKCLLGPNFWRYMSTAFAGGIAKDSKEVLIVLRPPSKLLTGASDPYKDGRIFGGSSAGGDEIPIMRQNNVKVTCMHPTVAGDAGKDTYELYPNDEGHLWMTKWGIKPEPGTPNIGDDNQRRGLDGGVYGNWTTYKVPEYSMSDDDRRWQAFAREDRSWRL